MGDQLFRRSFRLTVADREFGSFNVERPLSFSFNVQRDSTLTPNNCNVLIYNLSDDTRNQLEQLSGGFGQGSSKSSNKKLSSGRPKSKSASRSRQPKAPGVAQAPADAEGVVVRLEAGYGEHIGQLFFGTLRKVSSWQENGTWYTQISGGDSEHSITTAKISKTFKAGTPIGSVVRELVATLGVGPGGLNQTLAALQTTGFLSGGATLPKALTFHGDSATALEQVMRSCGFSWAISDGAFYAGPAGTPTLPGQGPLFTPNTGLIGVPSIDKNGKLTGRALLHADLLPGRVFRVESSRVQGDFLCEKTQHKGDTFGGEWIVEFLGRAPAKGSKAADLAKARGDTGWI